MGIYMEALSVSDGIVWDVHASPKRKRRDRMGIYMQALSASDGIVWDVHASPERKRRDRMGIYMQARSASEGRRDGWDWRVLSAGRWQCCRIEGLLQPFRVA
jgi:hypothetical protein